MVHVFNHPLIKHKLTNIRIKDTGTKDFRETISEIGSLMIYEITRDLKTKVIEIETPLCKTKQEVLNTEIVIIPILRAGLGMVEGIHNLIPTAKIGHVGLARDEDSLIPVEYYFKTPELKDAFTIIVDPMLATGGSLIHTISLLKKAGATNIVFVGLVGAPEGLETVKNAHPDVKIYLAALDEKLNEVGYIVPGLGDAGDRIFGTK